MPLPGLYVSGPSRSGTTLLAAVLDAHPRVHMGYELIPPAGFEVRRLADLVERLAGEGEPWPRAIGNRVRDHMTPQLGQFVKRTARAGADAGSLTATLEAFAADVSEVLETMADRLALARAIVVDHAPQHAAWTGFKAGGPQLAGALALAPGSRVIGIVRDPRDLVVSQLESGMAADAATAARRWEVHLRQLESVDRDCLLRVRYEDLIAAPAETIDLLCEWLALEPDGMMLRYEEAKVGVLVPGQTHANDAALRRGFFSDSVGRWRGHLDRAAVSEVEELCAERMAEFGYRLASTARAVAGRGGAGW